MVFGLVTIVAIFVPWTIIYLFQIIKENQVAKIKIKLLEQTVKSARQLLTVVTPKCYYCTELARFTLMDTGLHETDVCPNHTEEDDLMSAYCYGSDDGFFPITFDEEIQKLQKDLLELDKFKC
jgi:hypothetical protein